MTNYQILRFPRVGVPLRVKWVVEKGCSEVSREYIFFIPVHIVLPTPSEGFYVYVSRTTLESRRLFLTLIGEIPWGPRVPLLPSVPSYRLFLQELWERQDGYYPHLLVDQTTCGSVYRFVHLNTFRRLGETQKWRRVRLRRIPVSRLLDSLQGWVVRIHVCTSCPVVLVLRDWHAEVVCTTSSRRPDFHPVCVKRTPCLSVLVQSITFCSRSVGLSTVVPSLRVAKVSTRSWV